MPLGAAAAGGAHAPPDSRAGRHPGAGGHARADPIPDRPDSPAHPELPPVRPGADREARSFGCSCRARPGRRFWGRQGRSLAVDTPSGRAEVRGPLQVAGNGSSFRVPGRSLRRAEQRRGSEREVQRAGLGARMEEAGSLRRVVAVGPPGVTRQDFTSRLAEAGFAEPGRLVERGSPELCTQGNGDRRVCGTWLRVTSVDDRPVRAGARAYRGSLEIRRVNGGLGSSTSSTWRRICAGWCRPSWVPRRSRRWRRSRPRPLRRAPTRWPTWGITRRRAGTSATP